MPRPFVAHRSYAHRLACLSLYKALLKECAHLSAGNKTGTSNGISSTLQSLVRYRFQKDKSLVSLAAIENGLNAGNDFLRLLQACVAKSTDALDKLGGILQSTMVQAGATAAVRARNASFWQPPSPAKLPRMEHIRRVSRKDLQQASPDGPAVSLRPKPLSEITWPTRKVPVYLITCGIPVLKYPGPQPVLMNRVIKQKWRRTVKAVDMLENLEEGRHLAETEDVWDELIEETKANESAPWGARTAVSTDSHGDELADGTTLVTWHEAFDMATHYVQDTRRALERKNKAMGEKLFKVLVAERELKEEERRAAKQERRMARKRALGYVSLSAGVDEGAVPVDADPIT